MQRSALLRTGSKVRAFQEEATRGTAPQGEADRVDVVAPDCGEPFPRPLTVAECEVAGEYVVGVVGFSQVLGVELPDL